MLSRNLAKRCENPTAKLLSTWSLVPSQPGQPFIRQQRTCCWLFCFSFPPPFLRQSRGRPLPADLFKQVLRYVVGGMIHAPLGALLPLSGFLGNGKATKVP